MSHSRKRYLAVLASGPSTERMSFFSDAVFAIAMTVLVLEVQVPDVEPDQLAAALVALVPRYLAFLLSFVVLGLAWLAHHRKLAAIERFDPVLPRLNLALLLVVASFPLPTALLASYADQPIAAALYAGSISLLGGLLTLIWWHAWRRGLTAPRVTRALFGYVLAQSLVIPVVFAVSIPLALLVSAQVCEFFWLVALVVLPVVGRVSIRPHLTEQPA